MSHLSVLLFINRRGSKLEFIGKNFISGMNEKRWNMSEAAAHTPLACECFRVQRAKVFILPFLVIYMFFLSLRFAYTPQSMSHSHTPKFFFYPQPYEGDGS
jgi:hypothetical protein